MRSTKSKKIKYGDVDLPEEAFNPKYAKFRVTMFIDLDVLDEIRRQAARKGLPYQTYINQHLRRTILESNENDRIRSMIREEIKKYKP